MDADEKRTALEEQVAEALRRHPDKTHTIYEQAGAVLDALGLEQVGWGYEGDPTAMVAGGVHFHREPQSKAVHATCVPVYRVAASGRVTEGKEDQQ